jgi:predicted glycosyltransferase
MFDYEFVFTDLFTKYSAKVLVPDLVPDEAFDKRLLRNSRLVKFPGIKEQLYATDFVPNDRVLDELRLDRGSVIVVLRPPATVAHYHVEASERLFDDSIEWLEGKENIITVVLPRTKHQYESLAKSLHGKSNFRLLAKPINGLSLLYHSDIVISGGGTMNREAAVLGLPVFSIFLGKEGAVDKYLSSKGLLTFVKSKEDLMKIEIRKRESKKESHEVSKSIGSGSEALMNFIINEIVSTVRK